MPRYVVDNNYEALEDTFDKGVNSIIPVTGQIVTASSSAGNIYKPEFVFDGLTTTQWAIAKTDTNPWIGVQFPNAIKLYKIILHPRVGNQKTTHIVTSCSLFGSNDGMNWIKIMESTEHVNKIVTIEFPVTRPYSYFRLNAQGRLQFGLSLIEMYDAHLLTFPKSIIGSNQNSIIPSIGQIISRSSVHLDNNTSFNTYEGEKAFDGNLNTTWISSLNDSNPWLKIEFTSKVIVNKIIVHSISNVSYATVPTNVTVSGSNDDIDWYKLGSDVLSTIELSIVKPFKFYKFDFIGPKLLSVSSIEMFEPSKNTDPIKTLVTFS